MSELTATAKPAALIPRTGRLLTADQFQRLSDVPAEAEWFANLGNAATRRAYEHALRDFMRFTGIAQAGEFPAVTRSHVIAWRSDLAGRVPSLSSQTIRHRLAALSSLFEYLCERNAITHNPVKGVQRPAVESYEGKTPSLGEQQALLLMNVPDGDSLKGRRDRAILATLLFHALRRDEVCRLKVKDSKQMRRGVTHLKVSGKGGKARYVPLHPEAGRLVGEYLLAAGHGSDEQGALFRPLHRGRAPGGVKAISSDGVYKLVRGYSAALGFQVGAHALRATAATNALDHGADMGMVQEWLGHASISTTRMYDRRKGRSDESPTFKVAYGPT